MNDLKDLFLLDPGVIFLNHGSFGAVPRDVFETYQGWQRRLERQPVKFLGRDVLGELRSARESLGEYVNAGPDDLVFIPNATFGVNVIARSLDFSPGEEILTTDQEYGACQNIWDLISRQSGVQVIQQTIPLPVTSPGDLLEAIWAGVTPRTRLIFLSHITSPTALRLPVAEICERAREHGILTLVDGAHAPGQIPLDLTDIGADFYTGNCHKWLLAPKGSAFLHAAPDRQASIKPLVVSWGWGENCPYDTGSRFLNLLEWRGTRDPAASLSVPAAIDFQKAHQWDQVQERCHQALADALTIVEGISGMPSLYGKYSDLHRQMAALELPLLEDPELFQRTLYQDYRIEVPVISWQGRNFLRISFQGYNQPSDLEALAAALENSLPLFTN